MSSLNKIIIVGVVSTDPDSKVTNAGDAMLRFSMKVDRPRRNAESPAQWDMIPVVAWRDVASVTVSRGQMVLVEGRVITRTYDDDEGNRTWLTEVDAREIRPLGQTELGAQGSSRTEVSSEASHKASEASSLETPPSMPESQFDFNGGKSETAPVATEGASLTPEEEESIPF